MVACLTIAGSDSGGNAGVQADLRAYHAYGVHGCTVFTALTAQNPFEVSAIHRVPSDFVAAQLDAVLGVYDIRGLKTGMLADPATIEIIAEKIREHREIAAVIDPVMIATSGARLISDDSIAALRKHLIPLARIITPNIPEAEELTGRKITGIESAENAAREFCQKFATAVFIKGGHLDGAQSIDILCDESGVKRLILPRIKNPVSTHGTGCTFASALSAELALGRDLQKATYGAKNHTHRAIAASCLVGNDCGVLGFVTD